MKRWTRAFLAVLLSVVLLSAPFASLAEVPPDAEPTVEITETSEPEATDAPESTEVPATDPPATDPPATEEPEQPEPEAPKKVEKLSFRKSEVEITLTEYAEGLEYAKLNALEVSPEGAKPEKIVWSVREEKDGRPSNEVAAFVDYDKDGEKLEGDYAEEDIKETRFEVYKAGTAYIRAALKSDGDVYAEFRLVVVDDLPTEAPETEQPTEAPETELPTEAPAPEATDELLVEELLPVEPMPSATDGLIEEELLPVEPTPEAPTEEPTEEPTDEPTEEPTDEPTDEPLEGELPTDDPGLDQQPMLLDFSTFEMEIESTAMLTVSPDEAWLNFDETKPFEASWDISAVEGGQVTWTSDKPDFAEVDAVTGLVTAKAAGDAVITATLKDGEGTLVEEQTATVHVGLYPTNLLPVGDVSAYALKKDARKRLAVTSANIPSPSVTWSTMPGDEAVATVDAAGLVTAVGPGTATITAESENGLTCAFTITVYSIAINPPAGLGAHARTGQTLGFTVTVPPPGGTVAWESSNPTVADFSKEVPGEVTTLSEGSTIIRAKLVDHEEIFAEYPLVVDDFGPGAGMQPSYILPIGVELPLSVANEPGPVQWTSTDPAVATVDPATGLLKTLEEGATKVTATAGGLTVSFDITVASVSLEPAGGTTIVVRGTPLQVTATPLPETLTPTWEWKSSDEDVATVDGNGLVSGVKAGTVTITATIKGSSNVSKSIDLTVNVPATGIAITGAAFDAENKAELFSGNALDLAVSLIPEDSNDEIVWDGFTPPAGIVATLSADKKTLHVEATLDGEGVMVALDATPLSFTVGAGEAVAETRTIVFRQSVTSVVITGTDVVLGEDGSRTLLLHSKPNAAGKGNTSLLAAEVLPATAANPAVVWDSSNEAVATVDGNGLVTAVGFGTTTISATSVTNPTVKGEVSVTVLDRAELITLDTTYQVVDRFKDDYTYTIVAKLHPATATEVYWRSSAPDIASIDQSGKVTCKKSGYALFTAYTSKDDFDHPDVPPTAPHAISIVKVIQHAYELKLHTDPFPRLAGYPDLAVAISQTVYLGVTVGPADATDPGYTVVSSNPSVLQVSGKNGLRGLRTGSATVTISANDTGSLIEPKVLVVWVVAKGKGVTSFKLSKTSISVTVGSTGPAGGYTLTGTSSPSKASYKGVRWYSADPTIATVTSAKSASGYVVGLKPGTTYVYGISSSGIVKSCKVTVNGLLPSGVRVTGSTGTLYVGEKLQLGATVSPTTVYNPDHLKPTAWRSSNPAVALVNDDGLVYAVSAGTTTIYAKTVNEKVGSFKITVKNNACYNDITGVRIVNSNGAMYAGGRYTLDYTLFLNGATESDPTLGDLGGLDGFDNVHFKPLRGLEIDYKILAYNTTNTQLIWLSRNTSVATIDYYSGLLTGKKAGSVEIRAKSRTNSNLKQYDTEIVSILPKPGSGLTVYSGASSITDLTLTYGSPTDSARQLTAQSASPGVVVGWESDNEQVAKIDSTGRVTAVGIGTATISAFPLGLRDAVTPAKVNVRVQRLNGTSEVKYRALVVGMYQTSGQAGYLPFGSNSTSLARSAIAKSSIDDARYRITFRNNSSISSLSSLQSAINAAFAGAQDGDVSILFLHSHGTVASNGEYRWHLYGTGSKAKYITGNDIINAVKGVKGHVVLCVASCYSGNDDPSTTSIVSRAKSEDARRFRDLGALHSLSIITSTDGKHQSGYLNTSSSIAVDFFSAGFNRALSGNLTVPGMFSRIKDSTAAAVADYKKLYGGYSQVGTNTVKDYWSPRAENVIAFNNT